MNKPLLSACRSTNDQLGKVAILSPASGMQLRLFQAIMHTAAASVVSLLRQLAAPSFSYHLVVEADDPKAGAAVPGIKTGTTTRVFTTTNSDGFLLQGDRAFSLFGLTLDASVAGTTVTFQYFNGTAYATLPLISTPLFASNGDKVCFFIPPADWVPGTTAAVGGDAGKYSILVLATVAGATAITATNIWVAESLVTYETGAAGQESFLFHTGVDGGQPIMFNGTEALVAYNSAANAKHVGSFLYEISQ